jgi:hypothetical protein
MPEQQTVLLLGGTGRTGRLVLQQLLGCDANVRAVVRSVERLPTGAVADPRLTMLEADLLSLSDEDLLRQVDGCDAVVSCLGHAVSLKGILGPPRDLVTQAMTRVYQVVESLCPAKPVKFILMSSVSVNHPLGLDAYRGMFERAVLWLLRGMMPPAKDNQRAADFLCDDIGMANPCAQWVAVRPDTLLEGDVSDYTLHEGLVSSLFAPEKTNMANVAHFMCELATDPAVWDAWNGKLPVIINGSAD